MKKLACVLFLGASLFPAAHCAQNKADINLPNNNSGDTSLIVALRKGSTEEVRLLLEAGADVDVTNNFGHTPLHIAVRDGNEVAVRLLLEAGADVDLPNKNGWSPLRTAVWKDRTEVVKLLIKAGADLPKNGDELKILQGVIGDEYFIFQERDHPLVSGYVRSLEKESHSDGDQRKYIYPVVIAFYTSFAYPEKYIPSINRRQ